MSHVLMHRALACAFALSLLVTTPAAGQEADASAADSIAIETPVPTLGGWAMLPSLFYSPETNLGGGLVALRFFHLPGADSARSSRFLGSVLATLNRQVVIRGTPELYLRDGDLRIEGNAEYVRFPDTFYGVGNDTPEEAAEDYTASAVGLEADARMRLTSWLSAGPQFVFAVREMEETEPGGLLERARVPGHDGGRIVMLGGQLASDTRDHPVNASRGHFARLDARWSTETWGSDYGFGIYRLDLRRYVPIGRSVLAFQALGSYAPGTVPFTRMPQLGGQNVLRGFFGGRYRDQTMAVLQAEARLPLWRWFGLALFGSAGEVAPAPADLTIDGLHLAGGLGLRIMIDPDERLNARIDYGITSEGTGGLYVTLGEAF